MLFVQTRIFVVRQFGVLCFSERIKFPNIRTNGSLFRRRFCKKDEDFRIFVGRKSFRPKVFFIHTNNFLFGRIFFYSAEYYFCSYE